MYHSVRSHFSPVTFHIAVPFLDLFGPALLLDDEPDWSCFSLLHVPLGPRHLGMTNDRASSDDGDLRTLSSRAAT